MEICKPRFRRRRIDSCPTANDGSDRNPTLHWETQRPLESRGGIEFTPSGKEFLRDFRAVDSGAAIAKLRQLIQRGTDFERSEIVSDGGDSARAFGTVSKAGDVEPRRKNPLTADLPQPN